MSSAALQAAPHQPTSVSSHSPVVATSSNRPYTAGSSQSREQQYYNQSPSNASPSSARRPSRRPSGNGANSNSNSQQQQAQYYSPSANVSSSGQTTSRGQNSTNNVSSPAATLAPGSYSTMAPGDPQTGRAPVVSPRTSSNRNTAHAAASAAERNSRRAGHEATNSPRAAQGDGSQDRVDRQRSNGNTHVNGGGEDAALAAANAAARSRRRQQPSAEDVLPHRPSGSSRDSRAPPQSSSAARAAAASTRSPDTLPRENSQVLNVVKVSDPVEDMEREEERKAEAIPSSPTTQTPMGVVSNEGPADASRSGGRSRHDHSSKREKNTKFSDYFLGATLGEGEFGKVKMGWKQEGGVQASSHIDICIL